MYCSNCGSEVDNKYCANCGNNIKNNKYKNKIESKKFSNKFKKVFREMDYIETKIHKKEGIIFVNHVYSQVELLESSHHRKIFSVTEKIGDDVKNWHLRGMLSEEARYEYDRARDKVDKRLQSINKEIACREPTWWESMKDSLTGFIDLVMHNIPELSGWLLSAGKSLSKLPGPAGIIGGYVASTINSVFKASHKKAKNLLEHY